MEPMKIAVLHIRDTREHDPGFQLELDELNASAATQILAEGHEPELVATWQLSLEQVQQLVDCSDAVIIMGGEDVDPEFYNGPEDYPGSGTHEPQADRIQIAAIRYAMATGTPLLGICRGMQLLNVALGGTLVQHLHNVQDHRREGTDPFAQTRVGFVAETLAEDLSSGDLHLCSHHQAIHALGAGLQIAAMSSDGVIEAVVHDSAKATAVQWHPEHSQTAAAQLGPLIRRLAHQHAQPAAGEAEILQHQFAGA